MQIKRSIEKIPGGMMLVPLFLGALCHTFSPEAGKYFGSFTNGMITGTVPILAVWFFCMGASIKLSATGTVLRKSGTLVVTKIAVAWVVAAIASRIIPEHGVEVGFFARTFNAGAGGGDGYDQRRTLRFHHAAVRHKRRSWGICVDVIGVRAAHDDDYSGHCRDCLV